MTYSAERIHKSVIVRWGPMTFEERFWLKVDRTGGPDACWPWLEYRNPTGYGQVSVQSVRRLAHRVAYELLVGPISSGLTIDHLCMVKACVNPRHMEPVTQAVNNVRKNIAWSRARTHCKRGHELEPWTGPGGRRCRPCERFRAHRTYLRLTGRAA